MLLFDFVNCLMFRRRVLFVSVDGTGGGEQKIGSWNAKLIADRWRFEGA
jgi:hypothetical protein